MNSYQYKISLHVRHPSMDPAEITCMLRFPPSRSHKAHEPRMRPAGQLLGGVWPETHWSAKVMAGEWPGKTLSAAIAELLGQLASSRSFLARVRSEGGTVELLVGWFLDGSIGEVFDCELLARIADFKIDLRLDPYPPDRTPVNLPIYKTIALPDGKKRILYSSTVPQETQAGSKISYVSIMRAGCFGRPNCPRTRCRTPLFQPGWKAM